jgi:phage N-6-adenine-methyltransferase
MANDTWATPQPIYDALDLEFGFCADMAASKENHKHDIYWAEQDKPNSLSSSWGSLLFPMSFANPWVWCNPPYSDIGPWVDKAIEAQRQGVGTVMLVMADPSVLWFAKATKAATEIRFVTEGRLAFLENGKPKSGNNKGSVFFIFAPKLIGAGITTYVTRSELLERGQVKLSEVA